MHLFFFLQFRSSHRVCSWFKIIQYNDAKEHHEQTQAIFINKIKTPCDVLKTDTTE